MAMTLTAYYMFDCAKLETVEEFFRLSFDMHMHVRMLHVANQVANGASHLHAVANEMLAAEGIHNAFNVRIGMHWSASAADALQASKHACIRDLFFCKQELAQTYVLPNVG